MVPAMNKLFYISLLIVIAFAVNDYLSWRECMAIGESEGLVTQYGASCYYVVDGAWIEVEK